MLGSLQATSLSTRLPFSEDALRDAARAWYQLEVALLEIEQAEMPSAIRGAVQELGFPLQHIFREMGLTPGLQRRRASVSDRSTRRRREVELREAELHEAELQELRARARILRETLDAEFLPDPDAHGRAATDASTVER